MFRVPREGFEQSITFAKLYGISLNPQGWLTTEDVLDDMPRVISGVKADEFTSFLKLFIKL